MFFIRSQIITVIKFINQAKYSRKGAINVQFTTAIFSWISVIETFQFSWYER